MTLSSLEPFFPVPPPHFYGRCEGVIGLVGFAFHRLPCSLLSVLINCEMDREGKERIAKRGKFSLWIPCLENTA